MKNKNLIIALFILAIIAICILLFSLDKNFDNASGLDQGDKSVTSQDNQQLPPSVESGNQSAIEQVVNPPERDNTTEGIYERAYSTPFEFYGQVVDQDGNPIFNADIRYSVMNEPMESGVLINDKSDIGGFFSLKNKGAGLGVSVSKNGYYETDKSESLIRYGVRNHLNKLPSKEQPLIFVLHEKEGKSELIKSEIRLKISRNGSPIEIDLASGKKASVGQGGLKIQAWTYDDQKDEQGHYDWKVRLSVDQGGLIPRRDRFDFVAPDNGYLNYNEIVMSKADERWTPNSQTEYFVKLPNGNYARVTFRMIAGGDNFFTLKSIYNPTGSRNLE